MKSVKVSIAASTLMMIAALATTHTTAFAETTAVEKVQEGAEDAGKATKKAYRGAKDKVCEMVNGKMECAAKKAVNKVRNAKDEIVDKANDVKKEVN